MPHGVPLRGYRALLQDALSLPRLIIPQRSRDAPMRLKGWYTNLGFLGAVLALPFLSGLYRFVLLYATKWHSARRTG